MGCCKQEHAIHILNDYRVQIKKLRPDAKMPQYMTENAAGFDLSACLKPEQGAVVIIPPGKQALIGTGLAMKLPNGWELQIRPRSGLALKNEISITNSPGTLDADYVFELGIILRNNSDNDFQVRTGDRIAQGVLHKAPRLEFVEVEELEKTERTGGFGSTGV